MTDAPPFTVSPKAISMIAEISALIERYVVRLEQQGGLRLRRANKIKTIQSSLAIEGNALSRSQVSDMLDGKRVVAPLRDIQEVKNAINAYDLAPTLNPFSVDDLLKSHGVMMAALVDEAGAFRRGGVGVVSGKRVVHLAPSADRVPTLVAGLLNWVKSAEDHWLIRSCVFHYEFEFIHPFSDGNGRMGRLWQSLLLAKYHPAFATLPVESMVHDDQQGYYEAINASNVKADSGPFIDFMLHALLKSLKQHLRFQIGGVSGGVSGGVKGGQNDVWAFIRKNPGVRANAVALALGIPLRTVQRHLGRLKRESRILFRGAPRNGGYFAQSGCQRNN